jgi:small subunit ribosomal protein S16
MSVRIRLRRMGRKKQPHYRVVVADGAAPRDGRIVENLGYYRPQANPARLILDLDRFDYWVKQGAEPSDTVNSLASKARRGGDATVALGEPDAAANKQRETEALAKRRTAERKTAEAKGGPVQPQAASGGEEAMAGSRPSDTSPADAHARATEKVEHGEEPAGKMGGKNTEGASGAE